MTAARVIVTAETPAWAQTAGQMATGYAASVIGCDAEAGIERILAAEETPDGRPGVSLLLFAFSRDALQKAVVNRVGQCVLTCPTTACYNGLPLVKDKNIRIGGNLRFFGDGFSSARSSTAGASGACRSWTASSPARTSSAPSKGVAGGNFLILGSTPGAWPWRPPRRPWRPCGSVPGVILPFPGGVVRSGSKVGSRYKKLRASTNDAYCPTLRGLVRSALPEGANAVYEIVIDGVDLAAVEEATRVGVRAACSAGRAAHHRRQLRRQARAVPSAPA